MKIIKMGSLQIEPEAKHLSTAFLTFQKFGFVILGLILLAAFLGLFGKGLLSATVKTDGNLAISYEKFIRQQASSVYQITISPKINSNTKVVKLWINQSFYKNLSLKSVIPTPAIEEISDDKVLYTFNVSNPDKINITLVIEPEELGVIASEIGLSSGERIQLNQLIYP